MKKKIKINDLCFYGDKTSSKYHDSVHIEWDRLGGKPKTGEPVFFTDSCLTLVQRPIYKDAFKIAWLVEPPVIRTDTYQFISQNYKLFDLVLTHQMDFIPTIPNAQYYVNGMSWVADPDWTEYPKTKNISIVASDKNYAPGHQLRHRFLQLNKTPIDIFGSCTGKFFKDKSDAGKDYRFQIVIENCQSKGYFTEKLLDPMATHTIPIYWGCPNINDYYDEYGIIECGNVDILLETVSSISQDAEAIYNRLLPSAKKNFELSKEYKVAEDWIYKNVLVPRGLV
jgi:hypothetical protein